MVRTEGKQQQAGPGSGLMYPSRPGWQISIQRCFTTYTGMTAQDEQGGDWTESVDLPRAGRAWSACLPFVTGEIERDWVNSQ